MRVTLWHGYRGEEKRAIEEVARMFNLAYMASNIEVSLLNVSYDAMGDKLRAGIPNGRGPDVFVGAHDGTGSWADNELILPLERHLDRELTGQYYSNALAGFTYLYPQAVWALPGSFKNIALFYNADLVKNPPQKMSELVRLAREFTDAKSGQLGRWGFVYETGNFYYHTMWVQGFGGRLFRQIGRTAAGYPIQLPLFYSKPMVQAAYYWRNNIQRQNICPDAPSNPLVTRLFNTGNALFVVSGQWFRGEITKNVRYGLSQLPYMDQVDGNTPCAPNSRAIPFLTVEGYFMTSCAKNQKAAIEVIRYFTSPAAGRVFAAIARHTPANRLASRYSEVVSDPISGIFRQAAEVAVPAPNFPEMALAWAAGWGSLSDILGGMKPEDALLSRQKTLMAEIEKIRGKGIFDEWYGLGSFIPVK